MLNINWHYFSIFSNSHTVHLKCFNGGNQSNFTLFLYLKMKILVSMKS